MHAVLLAGGKGERLAAVSGGKPKPMVDVAGRPFIEYVLDGIVAAGCHRVVMAVAHKWQVLRDHFGGGYKGLDLCWSVEPHPLGTGGATRLAFDSFALDRALVVNADTLFLVDLKALQQRHSAYNAQVTIALKHLTDVSRYGSVELGQNDQIVGFHEKGRQGAGLINGGIYVMEKSALQLRDFPESFSLERDLLQKEVQRLRPFGMPSTGYFIDIGVPADLERARRELQSRVVAGAPAIYGPPTHGGHLK